MTPDDAVHRAQLADMPLAAIAAYLRERGYWVEKMAPELPSVVIQCNMVCRVYDRLPAGYPPMGDEDLPFDAERDGR